MFNFHTEIWKSLIKIKQIILATLSVLIVNINC